MRETPSRGIFVAGTDTGVGKTHVAAELVSDLRRAGIDAVPMKPVQTGCVHRGGRLVATDLEWCLKRARVNPDSARLADMAPYCFRPACSPHLAAARVGRRISVPVIMRAFRRLGLAHECVVVEGAGGILVPLNSRRTMLDLMVEMNLPVLLVARPGLGTINHTLLSLRILRQAGVDVMGVVLNQASPGRWGLIERDNLATIEKFGAVPVMRMRHVD